MTQFIIHVFYKQTFYEFRGCKMSVLGLFMTWKYNMLLICCEMLIGWTFLVEYKDSPCFLFKIIVCNKLAYLTHKSFYRTEIHNLNTRFWGSLSPKAQRTEFFQCSLSYIIAKTITNLLFSWKSYAFLKFKLKFQKCYFYNIRNCWNKFHLFFT